MKPNHYGQELAGSLGTVCTLLLREAVELQPH